MSNIQNKIINGLIKLTKEPFVNLRETRNQTEWHHDFILHIASILRPKVYVELGLRKCPLFNRMIPFADQLIGVDLDTRPEEFMIKNAKTKFVLASTLDYAASLESNPIKIDMLFIDADHSKESVEADFLAFFPYVVPHGIIIFHDSHPKNQEWTVPHYCGDGYLAVEKLSKHIEEYEMMTIPFHPGLTLCRKRKQQISWLEEALN